MTVVFDLISVRKTGKQVSDGREKAPLTTHCSQERKPLLIPTISIEEDVAIGPTTWIRRPTMASIASYSASEISST